MKKPLSESELKDIAQKLGLRPKDFIRKGETEFKKLNLALSLEDDEKLFKAMSKYPKMYTAAANASTVVNLFNLE